MTMVKTDRRKKYLALRKCIAETPWLRVPALNSGLEGFGRNIS
jgi:hypothetical protein